MISEWGVCVSNTKKGNKTSENLYRNFSGTS